MPTNKDRALWGHDALLKFAGSVNTTIGDKENCEDAIADLICDLGHYARSRRLDYKKLVERGVGMWNAERRHPKGDPYENDLAELIITKAQQTK